MKVTVYLLPPLQRTKGAWLMSILVVSENGVYPLPFSEISAAMQSSSMRVSVVSNTASAICEFGELDSDGDFFAFQNGVITTDNTVSPGKGTRLAVSVTGILSGSVTIRYFPID